LQEKTKEVYSLLQDIFKNVWEQQKYSELKNGVLLTLNIAIFVVIIRAYLQISEKINANLFLKYTFLILMILCILHIVCIIQSFFPKDNNDEKPKWSQDDINIFFFGDIQKLNKTNYLTVVLKKVKIQDSEIEDNVLLNLSNQIIKVSEVTQFKYDSFKNSVFRMYIMAGLFLIYFSYLFLNIPIK